MFSLITVAPHEYLDSPLEAGSTVLEFWMKHFVFFVFESELSSEFVNIILQIICSAFEIEVDFYIAISAC